MDKIVLQFISRLVAGLIIGILVGKIVDEKLNTTPWVMIGLIIYVIFGSLYILIKGEK
ncbi:MAG: hypothetical protein GX675_00445 [Erysipelotrichaceae bacterium]|nr:hypothetical protein [Erysipelotrichaceae bacterium]